MGSWRHGHCVVSSVLTAMVVAAHALSAAATGGSGTAAATTMPSPPELLLLTLAVAFFGIPHGATVRLLAGDGERVGLVTEDQVGGMENWQGQPASFPPSRPPTQPLPPPILTPLTSAALQWALVPDW